MDWILMALAAYNLSAIAMVLIPRTFHDPNNVATWLVFITTLLATELAWFWLPLQILLSFLFILGGALESRLGAFSMLVLAVSWLGLVWNVGLGLASGRMIERGLVEELGNDYLQRIPPERRSRLRTEVGISDWRRPFSMRRPGVEVIRDLAYAPGGIRTRLDVYRPENIPEDGCPVLLHIHGGAFMTGDKKRQALPLMYHLAERGWICVAANYRLSPSVGFPVHLEDCKAALCWIRREGMAYGMRTDFVAVTGGSAGGQLAALMGLTANRPEYQRGNEDIDTSVQACVPLYGAYDPLHRFGQHPNAEMVAKFLIDKVMHDTPENNPELWDQSSAIMQIHEQAPPFMVIHGTHDSLCPVADGRIFSEHLRAKSHNPVIWAELEGAEHAFDVVHSPRTEHTVDGIHRFLEWALTAHQDR